MTLNPATQGLALRLLVSLGFMALPLSTTAAQDADPNSPLMIQGELTYLARVALLPDTLAILELLDRSVPGGQPVATEQLALDGRQVPIPFALEVARDRLEETGSYAFRGTFLVNGLIDWVTEPLTIDPTSAQVDLGTILMLREEPIALNYDFLCGDQPIRAGFDADRMRLEVGDEGFDLRAAVSASGARYVAVGDPNTSFWSKGERGTLELRGQTYPECTPLERDQSILRASGNEPFWSLRIENARVEFTADLGETWIEVALPEPELIEGGRRYANLIEDGQLTISLFDQLCVDTMSGMPHPLTVEVLFDGRALAGCGGDPADLLRAGEWVVEDLAGGGIIDRSRVTLEVGGEQSLSGRASCNDFEGSFELTGENLTFAPALGTNAVCAPALMDQERRFLELLAGVRGFALDETGALLLLDANETASILARRAD